MALLRILANPRCPLHLGKRHYHNRMLQVSSTAIAGNDITGSCFYVVGKLALKGGIYGPICAAMASGILWLYRSAESMAVGRRWDQ